MVCCLFITVMFPSNNVSNKEFYTIYIKNIFIPKMSGCEQVSKKSYCLLLLSRMPTEIKCFVVPLETEISPSFFPFTYTDSAKMKTDWFLGMCELCSQTRQVHHFAPSQQTNSKSSSHTLQKVILSHKTLSSITG